MKMIYGLLLVLSGPEELLTAARAARSAGLDPIDAFSPYPIEDLTEALGFPPSKITWIMLICGICGALITFGTITFSAVWHYPFNVGGRPTFSWPAFVPETFEMMVLSAALGGVFALAILSRLPRPHHPVFNDPRYREAEQGGYFLLLPDSEEARSFLTNSYPTAWKEVEE